MTAERFLEGRNAIVTGGARGIGAAIVAELALRGALVASGSPSGGESASAAFAAPLDLRDTGSVAAFVAEARRALGPIDIVVNCAGVSTHQLVEGHDQAAWRDVIEVNLSGPFRMIRETIGEMKARNWGRIINIASTAARAAEADHAAYCASKAGLLGLTRAVALEGAPHGVACVAVSPTWVETDMLRASAAEKARASGRGVAEEIAGLAAANPQNRLVQPREIAGLVAYLASDAAAAITMEDIQVNAGAHW